MQYSGELSVPVDAGIRLGLVGPDSRDAMMLHAQQFHEAGIPFIFDPGQGLPMFAGDDLLTFIKQAAWVIVNDYEGQLLQERTGLSPQQIAACCRAYVVTQGAHGSTVYLADETIQIPSVTPSQIVDPTGCGDAYRAGILYGLTHGLSWPTTGRLASLMGAIKIAHHGTQAHQYTHQDIAEQFLAAFGHPLQ
jgi:adenosine kinase